MPMESANAPMMWSSSFPLVPSLCSMLVRSSLTSRSTWLTSSEPVPEIDRVTNEDIIRSTVHRQIRIELDTYVSVDPDRIRYLCIGLSG